MPRRPPPTSLRLHKGPMPSRGQAKHTLPSVPRPVHVPSDVTRSTVKPAPEPRIMATPPHGSVYSQRHAHSIEDVNASLAYGQPRRRSIERGLDISGLALPYMPDPGRLGSGMRMSPVSVSSSTSSPSSTPSPSPSTFSQQPVRGPWDHSRAVSLPIDVGSVLALPKPVAISP